MILKKRYLVSILEMALLVIRPNILLKVIRNLEICIIKIMFNGIRKLLRH